jgi:hypothetical protein
VPINYQSYRAMNALHLVFYVIIINATLPFPYGSVLICKTMNTCVDDMKTPTKVGRGTRPEFLTPSKLRQNSRINFSIWTYLREEMLGLGEPGKVGPPETENITNFLQVPLQLETFLLLGSVMCFDSFLYDHILARSSLLFSVLVSS